jgi:hypothetical protein
MYGEEEKGKDANRELNRGRGVEVRNRNPGQKISPNSTFWSTPEIDKTSLCSKEFLAL